MTGEVTALLVAGVLGAVVGLVADRKKTQGIRLLDVLAVGPLVILAGVQRTQGQNVRLALVFTGAATITFNGANFLTENEGEK